MIARVVIAVMLAAGCSPDRLKPGVDPGAERWLRGQLHVHTSNSGDSETRPQRVASWYAKHGFDFVVFTDHNFVTDETSTDILLLRGTELTQNVEGCEPPRPHARCLVHVSALFVDEDDPFVYFPPPASFARVALYRRGVTEALHRGGIAMINHPNFY